VIERVGEIREGVTAYCDPLQDDMSFLVGYNDKVIKFVVGSSAELNDYVLALQHYEEIKTVKTKKL